MNQTYEIHIIEGPGIGSGSGGEEAFDRFEVWLDTDAGRLDGLCVGIGATREEALNSAIQDLQDTIEALRVMKAHP
jgi:hypothetical protein